MNPTISDVMESDYDCEACGGTATVKEEEPEHTIEREGEDPITVSSQRLECPCGKLKFNKKRGEFGPYLDMTNPP